MELPHGGDLVYVNICTELVHYLAMSIPWVASPTSILGDGNEICTRCTILYG